MDTLQATTSAVITSADRLDEGVIRVYMRVKGKTFRRVYEPGLPPVWLEGMYVVTPKQQIDLEGIFWALEPKGDIKEIVSTLPPPPVPKKIEPPVRTPFVRTMVTTVQAPKPARPSRAKHPPKPPKEKKERIPRDEYLHPERDPQIIEFLATGLLFKEIGILLELNERTIEGRIFRMRKRYKAKNLQHLVRIALKQGVIPLIPSADPPYHITGRERELIHYISTGLTAAEIAPLMNLSNRSILRKLVDLREECKALTLPHLVAIAISDKIIT